VDNTPKSLSARLLQPGGTHADVVGGFGFRQRHLWCAGRFRRRPVGVFNASFGHGTNAANPHDPAPFLTFVWPDLPDAAKGGTRKACDALGNFVSYLLFVLGVGLQHEFADALLRGDVSDRTQQRVAATLTVDGVLAGRERDVAAVASATFPNGE